MPVSISTPSADLRRDVVRLKNEIGSLLGCAPSLIHHIGSTAVPGLDGKNIIDILISADNQEHMGKLRDKLVAAGYFPSQKPNARRDTIFLASRQEETGEGDVHIHLAIVGTKTHDNFLILRDYLMSHGDEVANYSQAKYEFAELADHDREAYKKLKAVYVDELLQRAQQWQSGK